MSSPPQPLGSFSFSKSSFPPHPTDRLFRYLIDHQEGHGQTIDFEPVVAEVIQQLQEKEEKISVLWSDKFGWSATHLAVILGKPKALEILIKWV